MAKHEYNWLDDPFASERKTDDPAERGGHMGCAWVGLIFFGIVVGVLLTLGSIVVLQVLGDTGM